MGRGCTAGPGAARFARVSESTREQDWLGAYRGLAWPQAEARARAEGRPVRVLRPGSVVTLDFRPDRLNIHLDEHDELRDLTAG